MINNINPNLYNPNSCMPSASAVNIQIFNPQAYSAAPVNTPPAQIPSWNVPVTTPYPPINTPVYNVPQNQPSQNNQPVQPPVNAPQLNPEYTPPVGNEGANVISNDAGLNKNKGLAGVNGSDESNNTSKKEPKVILTDEYIKNLENYLNSEDPKVRLMGAKELLERFKEDDSRADDKALNALLNKTIQDPNNTVKFVGLTTLDAGYSHGNDETVNILKNIQNDTSAQYGEDSLLASQILLKMSGRQSA